MLSLTLTPVSPWHAAQTGRLSVSQRQDRRLVQTVRQPKSRPHASTLSLAASFLQSGDVRWIELALSRKLAQFKAIRNPPSSVSFYLCKPTIREHQSSADRALQR